MQILAAPDQGFVAFPLRFSIGIESLKVVNH